MATVHELIPEGLRPEVEAALAWFNAREDVAFEVTGILDPDRALAEAGTRELQLILCGGDRCEQRSFSVANDGGNYDVALVQDDAPAEGAKAQAELDPPPGARRRWLDQALERHAFVVLVYYRGFW